MSKYLFGFVKIFSSNYHLVLYNFYILANSKLHILKSINFFLDHLDTSAIRLHYMDTDSFVMSLSKPLDELVLPGHESIWEAQKPNWFVMDPDCPDQQREPGENEISKFSLLTFFHVLNIHLRSFERRVQT